MMHWKILNNIYRKVIINMKFISCDYNEDSRCTVVCMEHLGVQFFGTGTDKVVKLSENLEKFYWRNFL